MMLLRSTLLYLPAQIVGPLFQLISVVAWTHLVGESTLGVITLVTATHELLQAVFLAWWSQYALRFFGAVQDGEETQRFYRTENAVLLLSVVAQSVAGAIVLHTVISPGASLGLSVAVIGYVVTRSYNLYLAERARVRHEVGVYSLQQVTGPALGFLLGLALIYLFGQEPEWPIAGYALAQAAAIVVILPIIRFGWSFWPIDRALLRQAMSYGVPLVLGGGLSWASINASRFIVSDMLGVAAAGLFAVGYGLGYRAATVAAMMVTASAFPIAVRAMQERGAERAMRQLADNGALLAAILLPSVAGVYMLRQEIVGLLIAPNFQAATLAILPLATLAGAIRNFRAHFADQVFLLQQRTRIMIVISAVEAVVTVTCSIAFIRWWGLTGAVVASAVSATVAAALSFICGMVIFRLRPPLLHLVKIVLAAATMMLALDHIQHGGGKLMLAWHIGLGATIYFAVLALLYAPTMKGMWRRRRAKPA